MPRESAVPASRACLTLLAVLLVLNVVFSAARAIASDKPNVLFILADDLGWMDTSLYGSKYFQTPEIERLASMGMKFTRAYSASPVCSPTRLSLLTGKYPARLKMTAPVGHLPPTRYRGNYPLTPSPTYQQTTTPISARYMPPEEYTLAEAFRDAGYRTGFVGKWHLGVGPEHWPAAQGFDFVFHGVPDNGPRSYFSPYYFSAGNVTDGPNGEYLTERATSEAIKFIKSSRERPWILFLWHWAVHAPYEAPRDLINKYASLKDPRGRQKSATMAGMIESLDKSVGTVLDTLNELDLAKSTIIVFYSDNGGNVYDRVDGVPPTDNYPLRGGKGSIYDGGTRVPAVFVWQDVIKAGTSSEALISSIDLYPTLLDMAKIDPKPEHVVDGVSIAETLRDNRLPERNAIFSHYPNYSIQAKSRPATYVIQGDWKFIRFYDSNGPAGYEPNALYNLRNDVGEQNNLWREMPDRVAEMDAMISKHLEDIGALLPIRNKHYDEKSPNPIYDDPIDSWAPMQYCSLRRENGTLRVIPSGRDPAIHTLDPFDFKVPVVLSFRMKTAGGTRIRLQGFDPTSAWERIVESVADNAWHEYRLEVTGLNKLQTLLFYLGDTGNEIVFDWIRLSDNDGKVIKSWEFDG